MMSNKKNLYFRIFIVVVMIFIYAAGIRYIISHVSDMGAETAEGRKHYVAIIAKSTESNFWKTVFVGANAASTEYNLSIKTMGPDNEEDYESQNRMIKEAVEEGARVIVFSAVDYNANADAIDEAVKKGVKVVVIDSDVNSDNVSCRISTDNYQAGKMAGEAALNCDDGVLNIGLVNYDKNSANGQQREEGFRDRVGEEERSNIVETINVISTIEDAKQGTIELLERHPEINTIATFNEWTSLGVGEAIKELGLADEISVIAFDNNAVTVGMLETGEVDALIVQNQYAMGYLGVEAAYNLIHNIPIDDTDVDTSTTLVTKENMFQDEFQRVLFSFEQ